MNNKRIVVIGSSNTDMVIKAGRIPVPGETIIGSTFMMNPGGKGANQAVSAARLGGKVTFITKTGDDLFGRQAVEGYKKEGIDTGFVFSDPDQPSGVALITVDAEGENCIVVAPGANATLGPEEIDKSIEAVGQAEMILIQLEIPIQTVEYVARIASQKGIKVILNPAPAQPLSSGLLQNLYMIVPNSTEAGLLSGIKVNDWDTAKEAAIIIGQKGVDIVVVTLGPLGALIKERSNFYRIEAEKVRAVDTTAAGDTFCGALCVGLSEGKSIIESVRFACKAAAISVTRPGAQASVPYRNEIPEL